MTIDEIRAVVAQFPSGATARDVAIQRWGAPTPYQSRAIAGYLGLLAARGMVIRRGRHYFPSAEQQPAIAAALPPAAWYATPLGPRWWDGARWW